MVGTVMRAAFYISFVVVLVLLVWSFATARSWQEAAESAGNTQVNATNLAKNALARANRCFDELYKNDPAAKTTVKRDAPVANESKRKP